MVNIRHTRHPRYHSKTGTAWIIKVCSTNRKPLKLSKHADDSCINTKKREKIYLLLLFFLGKNRKKKKKKKRKTSHNTLEKKQIKS